MTQVKELYRRLIKGMDVDNFDIPVSYVKFYFQGDLVPTEVLDYDIDEETVMCCQATRHASLGNPVYLNKKNIGCIAAAISLGLVDKDESKPLNPESRVYTDIMKKQSEKGSDFQPPSPLDFSNGNVYACKDASKPQFCLFGKEDSGRFKDVKTAQKAIDQMTALQPAKTAGVFIYGNEFLKLDLVPDVVVMSVRPVELARLVQGYQYETGKRVQADMAGLRAVDSDLIARPYLTGNINVATYCLGARLVARFEADRMGMGIPFKEYLKLIEGLEKSTTGYPFPRYPGAV